MKVDLTRKITARTYALLQIFARKELNLRDNKENEEITKSVSFFHFFV